MEASPHRRMLGSLWQAIIRAPKIIEYKGPALPLKTIILCLAMPVSKWP